MHASVVFYVKCLLVLSPGVPFYRPREGTGLHGAWDIVGYGRDEGIGQLEASVLAVV